MSFKTTTELTAGLAQGLHNAPKLYGDKTVRPPEKITGWQSGLKTAGKFFCTSFLFFMKR